MCCIKHLRDRIDDCLEWDTSLQYVINYQSNTLYIIIAYRFSSERNASVTSEIVKSITNENYSLSLVRSELS